MTLANAKSVNCQTLENVVRNAASEFTRRTAIASLASLPKGPFRTKNTTTIAKIVTFLRRSVFTMPPRFTMPGTLLREGKCLEFPGKGCLHKVRRDSKSQGDSKFTTRSKFTTCSIFSTAGSFG